MRLGSFALGTFAAAIVMSGCGKSATLTPAQRGRQAYLANCTACHNIDPNRAGSQGPAVAGSSRELVEARVMHATYPPGYKPKRDTHAMVALPHLRSKIDDLAAFLADASSTQTGNSEKK